MKHFVIPRRVAGERSIRIAGADFHYLTRVLRMREGDELAAVDAAGTRFTLRVSSLRRGSCRADLLPAGDGPADSDPPGASPWICLLQCLPKGRKMDLIVRQAVEAGVGRIVAIVSERSIAVPSKPGDKLVRWHRIAREAVQQSGTPAVPEILGPLAIGEAAGAAGPDCTGLFFHQERLGGRSLHEALAEAPRRVALLVGPEGGLSERETDLLTQSGFSPVFLGDAVLRVETAALYAVAAVKTVLRERDKWTLSQPG